MFIRVILPLCTPFLPTYSAPDDLLVGDRVSVRLSGRVWPGVVAETEVVPDIPESKIFPVVSVDRGLPRITKVELQFWKFLADYYLCSEGEVFKAAYPKNVAPGKRAAASGEWPDLPEPTASVAPSRPVVLVGASREEEYLSRMEACIGAGRAVFFLTPTRERCAAISAFLSSRLTCPVLSYLTTDKPARRRSVTDSIRRSEGPYVAVGTRSSVFLPFHSLGLIVVDEEQDPSYKQNEPDPRFSARDAAVILASIHGAEVILGSALPSLETIYNIRCGKYESRMLTGGEGARVEVVSLSDEKRKSGLDGAFCYKAIEAVRASGAESLLVVCGWETEEEVRADADRLFPGVKVAVAARSAAPQLPYGEKVDAVLLLCADAFFRREDFRSDEKAVRFFAAMRRRAGRIAVFQTSRADHNVFRCLSGDETVLDSMMEERRRFCLPPYCRLVDVIIRDTAPKRLALMASRLEKLLLRRLPFDAAALNPVTRVGESQDLVVLRLAAPKQSRAFKSTLKVALDEFVSVNTYPGHFAIDVDPVGW